MANPYFAPPYFAPPYFAPPYFGSSSGPVTVTVASAPALIVDLGATDEALAVRCGADWPLVVPPDQVWAEGGDGTIVAPDPWTLTSSSDFGRSGVVPGNVLQLLRTPPSGRAAANPATGADLLDLLAVDASRTGRLALRRKGRPGGVGRPPTPGGPLYFRVAGAAPQAEQSAAWLARTFSLTADADPATLADFSEGAVLRTLWKLYEAAARMAGMPTDDFEAKAGRYEREFRDELTLLYARYDISPALHRLVAGSIQVSRPASRTRPSGAGSWPWGW